MSQSKFFNRLLLSSKIASLAKSLLSKGTAPFSASKLVLVRPYSSGGKKSPPLSEQQLLYSFSPRSPVFPLSHRQKVWEKAFTQGTKKKAHIDPYRVSRVWGPDGGMMTKDQIVNFAVNAQNQFVSRSFLSTELRRRMTSSRDGSGGGGGKDSINIDKIKEDHLPVAFEQKGVSRVISLRRPEVLHSLNLEMIRMLSNILQVYQKANNVKNVILTSVKEGAKAVSFCAGGDVVAIAKSKDVPNSNLRRDFFAEEYALNHYIGTMSKPVIALIDGITMGGGVGISVHAPFRVCTERTVFAMPETSIGFFPDVGGTFFLSRMDGNLGKYLGLTGERLKGVDNYFAGIATHYVPSHRLPDLVDRVSGVEEDDINVYSSVLDEFSETIPADVEFSLNPLRSLIDEYFASDDIGAIAQALMTASKSHDSTVSTWAKKTFEKLKSASPISLVVTLEALKRGKTMSFAECLLMEYQLSQAFMSDNDFYEGVNAKLVHKGKVEPKWNPPTVVSIDRKDLLKKYFDSGNMNSISKSDFFFISSNESSDSNGIADYTSYPSNFGLPRESELASLISTNEFESIDHVLKFLKRDLNLKPGLTQHVTSILKRKTQPIGGLLKWATV